MKITKSTIAQIQSARKRLGLNQTQLGELVGLDRSTVSKLLAGQINTMKPEMVDVFNDQLQLDLRPMRVADEEVSPTLIALSKAAKADERIAGLLEDILTLTKIDNTPFMPDVPTKDLSKIGSGVKRIVFNWDSPEKNYDAKAGAEVLDYIRDYYRSWKRR